MQICDFLASNPRTDVEHTTCMQQVKSVIHIQPGTGKTLRSRGTMTSR